MFGILVAIEVLVSVVLVIVVLMQSSKGGGLAGSFGGAQMGTVFGVRRTADFLSRSTTILATIFILLCIVINLFFLPGRNTDVDSIIQRSGTQYSRPVAQPPQAGQTAPTQQGEGK